MKDKINIAKMERKQKRKLKKKQKEERELFEKVKKICF